MPRGILNDQSEPSTPGNPMTNMPRGLCPNCSHVREIVSGTGSRFLLCRLSQSDNRYAKYPPQPVRECPAYTQQTVAEGK